MKCNFMPYPLKVAFTQDGDGYDEAGDETQHISVELYDGEYAAIKTSRWACSPTELRQLADAIENLLREQRAWVGNARVAAEPAQKLPSPYERDQ